MHTDNKTLVVRNDMTRQQFFGLFPWKMIVKNYILFIFYIVFVAIVLFSLEECLREDKQVEEICKRKVSYIDGKRLPGHTQTNDANETQIVDIEVKVKCSEKKLKHVGKENKKKCEITGQKIMEWIYFAAAHCHGGDTTAIRVRSRWGQIIGGPILIFGMVIAIRIYSWIGFVAVNMMNFGLRKLHQRFRPNQFKATLKYEIIVLSIIDLLIFVFICAAVSNKYKEGETYRESAFQWIMLIFSLSDEKMIDPSRKPPVSEIAFSIILLTIGYSVSSTFIAAIFNLKHRLTYRVNAQTTRRKNALQGWWV